MAWRQLRARVGITEPPSRAIRPAWGGRGPRLGPGARGHRTRYHLYYTVDEPARVVTVRVLWHAARGRRPAL